MRTIIETSDGKVREEPQYALCRGLGFWEVIFADFMRQHPWRSRECVQKCARAVSLAIRGLRAHLAGAVDREGKPDAVLQAFARHLDEHVLFPSDRGGIPGRFRLGAALPGWFTYEPPPGVAWEVQRPGSKVLSPGSKVSSRGAAVGYLARFLCGGLALALLATGCAGPRPLKGGRAVIIRKPAGVFEQALAQSENPAQATKQDQESVKVRSSLRSDLDSVTAHALGGVGRRIGHRAA